MHEHCAPCRMHAGVPHSSLVGSSSPEQCRWLGAQPIVPLVASLTRGRMHARRHRRTHARQFLHLQRPRLLLHGAAAPGYTCEMPEAAGRWRCSRHSRVRLLETF